MTFWITNPSETPEGRHIRKRKISLWIARWHFLRYRLDIKSNSRWCCSCAVISINLSMWLKLSNSTAIHLTEVVGTRHLSWSWMGVISLGAAFLASGLFRAFLKSGKKWKVDSGPVVWVGSGLSVCMCLSAKGSGVFPCAYGVFQSILALPAAHLGQPVSKHSKGTILHSCRRANCDHPGFKTKPQLNFN